MDWKLIGSSPIYRQLMEQLRRAVLSGKYPPGSRIPSVRELAAQAKVNPNTMQRALTELEREGLLETHGTQGRCVTGNQEVLDRLRGDAVNELLHDCTQRFRAAGLTMEQAAALLLAMEKEE